MEPGGGAAALCDQRGNVLQRHLAGGCGRCLQKNGFLPAARWASQKEVHEEHLLEAGKELFIFQCYACHTIGGVNNDILARTKGMSYPAMRGYLRKLHENRYFMPPFAGNDAEARALAVFIVKGLQGKEVAEGAGISGGAGRTLFESECAACHDEEHIRSRTAGWDRARIRKGLDKLSALNPGMPDFSGSEDEKGLLADFIVSLNRPQKGASAAGRDHGEEVFEANCSMCHTLRGGDNPLLPKVAGWDRQRIRQALDMLDKLRGGVMPPLNAPPADKDALTAFLVAAQQGGSK